MEGSPLQFFDDNEILNQDINSSLANSLLQNNKSQVEEIKT